MDKTVKRVKMDDKAEIVIMVKRDKKAKRVKMVKKFKWRKGS